MDERTFNGSTAADKAADPLEKNATNYVDGNSVFILGEFDDTISKNVVPNLLKIVNAQKKMRDGAVDFYINSPGGRCSELFSLLSMVALAKSYGVKVRTFNMGMAYSCASMLSVVGDERKMLRYARNLMHLGTTHSMSSTFTQVKRNQKRQKEHFDNIVSLYREHTKLAERQILEMMNDDCCFLGAAECLKYGLVDKVCDC